MVRTPTDREIAINGEFTLDRNITINNCDYFTFNKNVPLNLNGYKLTQFGSDFYSCDGINMWNGISGTLANSQYSASGTSTNLSRVRDAKTGVYISASGSVITSNTSFEDDNVGIEFAGTNNYSTSSITLTSFKTVQGLKAPFTSSLKGLHGLVINSSVSGITVGNNTAGLENTFDNLYNGIYSLTRNTLNLYRNIFTSITGTGAYPYYGKAGYIDVGTVAPATVNITGTGQNAATAALSNCDFGFLVKGFSSSSISDYKIDNVASAIQVTGALGTTMSIYNNTITNGKYGIAMLLNQSATQNIFSNIITVASPSSGSDGYYDITVQDYTGSNNYNQIYYNTLTNGRYGAYLLNNGANSSFHDNTIYMTSTSNTQGPVYGIYAAASNGATLLYNYLYGNTAQYNATYKKEAITIYQSQNMIVTCNTMNKFGYGIHFKGNCANTFLRINILGVASPISGDGLYYGLVREYFNGSDLIGTQGSSSQSHSNYMYGPFTNSNAWAAYHINTLNTQNFYYNPSDPSYLKTFTQGPLLAVQFNFFPSNSAALYNCPAPAISERSEQDEQDSTLTDSITILNAIDQLNVINSDTFATETESWMNQQILFNSVQQDSVITLENNDLQSFYDSTAVSDIGKLSDFTQILGTLGDSNGINPGVLLNATQINIEISDSFLFAANEKQVNNVYLSTIGSGIDTLNEEQKQLISTLAFSCPSVNGMAVFKARALYSLVDPTVYFEDDSSCLVTEKKFILREMSEGLNFYPNPTLDNTLVVLPESQRSSSTLIVYNFLGQSELNLSIPPDIKFYTILLTNFVSGIYRVEVTCNDKRYFGSLVITR